MKSDLATYLKLQTALVNEKTRLEARLAQISKVLGNDVSAPASTPASTGKRTFSEATKAKMRAAQKARWAKLKGKAGSAPAPAPAPVAKQKRKLSAAGRAAIVAVVKARWAKKKAGKAGA